MTLVREATMEEKAIYAKVDDVMNRMDDDVADALIDVMGEYAFENGKAHKNAYNKLYRVGKKYGFTVDELMVWYYCD